MGIDLGAPKCLSHPRAMTYLPVLVVGEGRLSRKGVRVVVVMGRMAVGMFAGGYTS